MLECSQIGGEVTACRQFAETVSLGARALSTAPTAEPTAARKETSTGSVPRMTVVITLSINVFINGIEAFLMNGPALLLPSETARAEGHS